MDLGLSSVHSYDFPFWLPTYFNEYLLKNDSIVAWKTQSVNIFLMGSQDWTHYIKSGELPIIAML